MASDRTTIGCRACREQRVTAALELQLTPDAVLLVCPTHGPAACWQRVSLVVGPFGELVPPTPAPQPPPPPPLKCSSCGSIRPSNTRAIWDRALTFCLDCRRWSVRR